MSSAALLFPAMRSSVTQLARLPSSLYAAAVAKGHLLPDPVQRAALPPLDDLVRLLPAYELDMDAHAASLAVWENAWTAAVKREREKLQRHNLLARAWRCMAHTAAGLNPDTPPEALPPSYYGLPDPRKAPTPPRGVYMYGDVGCGKSLLMDMVFTCADAQVHRAERVHYHSFMISVYELMHKYDVMTPSERAAAGVFHPLDAVVALKLRRLNSSAAGGGLLCFDEFQIADVADARLMHGILTRLMESGTIVCFTANRAPRDLNRSQLQDGDFRPFLDLLHDRCQLMNLKSGVDYRQVLSDADSSHVRYYLPGDAPEAALHELWQAETGTDWDDVVTRVLPVAYGRQFLLERASAAKNAAQLTTAQLIEAAVGASDFRALAEAVKTIFIMDVVPVFTSDTRNLARRFITLVDVCYEEKVRIVMRTEAEKLDDMFSKVDVSKPDASLAEGTQFETEVARQGVGAGNRALNSTTLYTGEDEAFAFDRAVSRLKEMQTQNFHRRTPVFW